MRRAGLLLPALLALAACVQVEERWELAPDGSGTYALSVRWDADVLQRVTSLLGGNTLARLEGRAFPLAASAWRDGLEGLEGVTIESLEERELEGGRRELAVRLAFRSLDQVLAWELLARRSVSLRLLDPGSGLARAEVRAEEGDVAELEMAPFARLPLLEALARIEALRVAPPPEAPEAGAEALRDLGIDPSRLDLVQALLRPRLGEVRLTVGLQVSGRVVSVEAQGSEPPDDAQSARLSLGFEDLVRGVPRDLRVRWRPRFLDVVPRVARRGDEPPRGRSR